MDTHMSFYAAKIIEHHWNKQLSLTRSQGATAEEIAEFQAKYDAFLPEDFTAYLSLLNGLAIPKDLNSWKNVESEGFEFYPLSAILPAPQCPDYYVFCHWSLGLLPFAICLGQTGRNGEVVSLRGSPSTPYFVASNFSLFAELYIQDSPQLYKPGPSTAKE
jgi:hypothetical protein